MHHAAIVDSQMHLHLVSIVRLLFLCSHHDTNALPTLLLLALPAIIMNIRAPDTFGNIYSDAQRTEYSIQLWFIDFCHYSNATGEREDSASSGFGKFNVCFNL